MWSVKQARKFIYQPSAFDNKYTRGVLGCVTGSLHYPGAAVLTTHAALQTGVGMVRFYPVKYSWSKVTRNFVERLVLEASPEVVIAHGSVSAWLVGSGVPSNDRGGFHGKRRRNDVSHALAHKAPTILDAGALSWAGQLSVPTLITPHYGELAELLQAKNIDVNAVKIAAAPKKWAIESAQILNVNVLLKGSMTFVTDGERVIELPEATAWLATAGTGDVLAGIVGALVATHAHDLGQGGVSLIELGATGALIHQRAATRSVKKGPISATALLREIPSVIADFR